MLRKGKGRPAAQEEKSVQRAIAFCNALEVLANAYPKLLLLSYVGRGLNQFAEREHQCVGNGARCHCLYLQLAIDQYVDSFVKYFRIIHRLLSRALSFPLNLPQNMPQRWLGPASRKCRAHRHTRPGTDRSCSRE